MGKEVRFKLLALLAFAVAALFFSSLTLVSAEQVEWNSCYVEGNVVSVEPLYSNSLSANSSSVVFETTLARNNSEAPCFFHANEEVTAVYDEGGARLFDLQPGDAVSGVLFQWGEQDDINTQITSVQITNPSCAVLEDCGLECPEFGFAKTPRGCFECACSVPPVQTPSESFFRFSFAQGWNFFSFPLAVERNAFCLPGKDCLQKTDFLPRVIATDCEPQSVVWRWTDGGKTYSEFQFPDLGKKNAVNFAGELLTGYWFKAPTACSVTIAGESVDASRFNGKELFKGWNSLGAVSVTTPSGLPVSFDSVKGDCVVEKGPYAWDAAQQKFVKPQPAWLEPGRAYFVKVARDCWLSTES